MSRPPTKPLTPDQQAIAADPRHLRLAREVASGWIKRFPIICRDALSAAFLGLVKAARSYDPHAGPFTAWAIKRIRWEILLTIRNDSYQGYRKESFENRPYFEHVELESVWEELAIEDDHDDFHAADSIRALTRDLPPRQREAIERTYLHADSLLHCEAAKIMGCCDARVSQLLKAGMTRIRKDSR